MSTLWQLSLLDLPGGSQVEGVVLKKERYKAKTSGLANLANIFKAYLSSPAVNLKIRINRQNEFIATNTDKFGRFNVTLDSNYETLLVEDAQTEKVLPINTDYPVHFDYRDKDFFVISDIDDTIMKSNTANFVKRIWYVLFKGPSKRKSLPFTSAVFDYLKNQNAGFFYLSKSESNLFGLISNFLLMNKFPPGKLLLTPHLSLRQLLFQKKDKAHKPSHIINLLLKCGNKKFILVGDDSQEDMAIYAEVAKTFPDRVLQILIRQSGKERSKKQKVAWEKVLSTGRSAVYFTDKDDPNRVINDLKSHL